MSEQGGQVSDAGGLESHVTRLLLATRSGHKASEIRRILGTPQGVEWTDLEMLGIVPTPEEDEVERFLTFEENARAKAEYFRDLTGLATLADDSGLEVDALDGRPGVRSKRFAPVEAGVDGEERDKANNEHLMELLGATPMADRTARYVCVAALAVPGRETELYRGVAPGLILETPKGKGGFGYDPLFLEQSLGKTFAELTQAEKNRLSHRGRAFREVARRLERGP